MSIRFVVIDDIYIVPENVTHLVPKFDGPTPATAVHMSSGGKLLIRRPIEHVAGELSYDLASGQAYIRQEQWETAEDAVERIVASL